MSRRTLVDVFAGVGGLSLGFETAGFQCLAGVESNPEHRKTLAGVHPGINIDFEDVTKLQSKRLLGAIGLSSGEVDVVVGGPPCQPFSMAGKREGEGDERGQLIHHFVRLVGEMRPRAFVMENVVGLKSIHGGRLLREILQDFVRLGYALSPDQPFSVNAAEYGVPQLRRRIFIIGLRDGQRTFELPTPSHCLDPQIPLPNMERFERPEKFLTVEEAISDLPRNGHKRQNPDDSSIEDDVECPYTSPALNAYQREMRRRTSSVTGNQTSAHFPHIIEAIKMLRPGEEEPRTRYRRLYPDRPAFTLRAGSGTFTALRPIHPHRNRVITVREAARLQSFPDWVNFNPVKKWAYQGIGNSVPPGLARVIATRLLDFLD